MLNGRQFLLVFTSLALAIIFIVFSPYIDQYVAALPYTAINKTFYGESALWCRVIYRAIPVITVLLILLPIVWFVLTSNNSFKRKKIIRFGVTLYLALSIGPGLVVNVIFKDHWGRPRPYQVLRDGKVYSPFWVPHFGHSKNNSFPGGHAGVGFFLGIPFLALKRKKTALAVSLLGGTIVGAVRILQGGHYLSDVLFSGIFVWLAALLVIYGVSAWYRKVEVRE